MVGNEYFSVYIYFGLVFLVTLGVMIVTGIPTGKRKGVKYQPYESGIQTETKLLEERFPLRHYLVGLVFLVFDVEVIFLFPWATVAKDLGPFAFYEMLFFIAALLVGYVYIWRKGGLEWD